MLSKTRNGPCPREAVNLLGEYATIKQLHMFKNCSCDKCCEGELKNAGRTCDRMLECWGVWVVRENCSEEVTKGLVRRREGRAYVQGTACAKARRGSKQMWKEEGTRQERQQEWRKTARLCRQKGVLICRPTENN